MNDKLKKLLSVCFWVLLWIYYSSYAVIVYWDSAHYYSYIPIIEGKVSIQEWDIVRGPVFPYLLYFIKKTFGSNNFSLVIVTFISYAIMIIFVKLILDKLADSISDKKAKFLFYCVTMVLIVINPILFGYYHALLTEFVALTLTIVSCYIAWKWIYFDCSKNILKAIGYTLFFVIGVLFSWFLKQPYVAVTLFPMLIAIVISVFVNFNVINLIYHIATIILCVFTLSTSIGAWNSYLDKSGLDLNTNRNVVSNFGSQLAGSSKNVVRYSEEQQEKFEKSYLTNSKLSKEEKEIVTKKLDGETNYLVFKVYNPKGKIDDIVVFDIENKTSISITQGLSILLNLFKSYPIDVSEGYITQYLFLSDVYEMTDDLDAWPLGIKKTINLDANYENLTIGSNIINPKSSIFPMTDELYNGVKGLEVYYNPPIIFQSVLDRDKDFFHRMYSITMLLLPFLFVASLVLRIVNRKKLKEFEKREYDLLIMLLGFSIMNACVYVFTGSCIDRYQSPALIPMTLSYMIYIKKIGFFVKNKIKKDDYESVETI